jgi:hypothetical protein
MNHLSSRLRGSSRRVNEFQIRRAGFHVSKVYTPTYAPIGQVTEFRMNLYMASPLLDFGVGEKSFARVVFDNLCFLFSSVFRSLHATLMSRQSDKNRNRTTAEHREKPDDEVYPTFSPRETLWHSQNAYAGLKLIPWSEIWASIAVAKLRGNTEMLNAFYDTLYKEAVFDDRGVWALNSRPRE